MNILKMQISSAIMPGSCGEGTFVVYVRREKSRLGGSEVSKQENRRVDYEQKLAGTKRVFVCCAA